MKISKTNCDRNSPSVYIWTCSNDRPTFPIKTLKNVGNPVVDFFSRGRQQFLKFVILSDRHKIWWKCDPRHCDKYSFVRYSIYVAFQKYVFSRKVGDEAFGPPGHHIETLHLRFYRLLPFNVLNIPSSQQNFVTLTFSPRGRSHLRCRAAFLTLFTDWSSPNFIRRCLVPSNKLLKNFRHTRS